MISRIIDKTSDFNASNGIKMDLSEYQFVSFQVVTPTGTINVTGTNDSGAVTGISNGGPASSTNYTAIQVIPLGTGTATTTITSSGIYALNPLLCKYVQLAGTGITVTKLLVFATTIN